ncbi:MAG: pantoate kinase [Candidatus Ranarchaeia archaeon]|jgi:pantoate kinase
MQQKNLRVFEKVRVFVPAGLSSFFEIHDQTPDGQKIVDPRYIGACGGGCLLSHGVWTEVRVNPTASDSKIVIWINDESVDYAQTTEHVITQCLTLTPSSWDIEVRHKSEVPIGAGFGTSGAGTLGAAFGLTAALGLPVTYDQLGTMAHIAEVESLTGLGTTGPILFGRGLVLQVKGGAPNIMRLDAIPVSNEYHIVSACYGPIEKGPILTDPEMRKRINIEGRKTMDAIKSHPTPQEFFRACQRFAKALPFLTDRVRNLLDVAETMKIVGVAQNMIGEAAHALVHQDHASRLVKTWGDIIGPKNVVESSIALSGPRITDSE